MITEKEIQEHSSSIRNAMKDWPKGEWNDEPDRLNWKHENGLDCMIVRNHFGVLCGYVGVKPNHKLYKVDYLDEKLNKVQVHGDLTYSDECSGHICHIDEDEDVNGKNWWFGFDCAHAFDLSPSSCKYLRTNNLVTYKNIEYVIEQTNNLAVQIGDIIYDN